MSADWSERKENMQTLDATVVTCSATPSELILYPRLRQFFRLLNRYFMVPVFRLGLGAFVGSPLGGYIMVVKTIGRKTGEARYTPVNYAIIDGNVYCLELVSSRLIWKYDTSSAAFNPDARVMSSPAIAGGRLFVGSMNGHFFCLGTAREESHQ